MEGVTILLWNTMEESAEVSHWLLSIGFTQNILSARGLELGLSIFRKEYNGSSLIINIIMEKRNRDHLPNKYSIMCENSCILY